MKEQPNKMMTEQESLALITEMIQKAKSHYHESGTSAILWGCVIGFCGLFSFANNYFKLNVNFDVWILALVAIIPQIWINIKDKKNKIVKTDSEAAIDVIWIVYSISIFALVFYGNVVSNASVKLYASDGIELLQKNIATGTITTFKPNILSGGSLFILLYAIPTLATGLIKKYKPMIVGAILCYAFFIISCFTSFTWDSLLNGLAAIFNWLIPGLLLRKKYLNTRP
jgi:hypothetical protein